MSGTASPSILVPNSESVGFQSLWPGTGDTKMHAPKNRNSPGTLLEPFAVELKSWVSLFSALANLRHVFIFKRNFGFTILPNHGKRHFFCKNSCSKTMYNSMTISTMQRWFKRIKCLPVFVV